MSDPREIDETRDGVSRRAFLQRAATGAAAAAAVGAVGIPAFETSAAAEEAGDLAEKTIGNLPGRKRANKACKTRIAAANFNKTQVAVPDHPDNGDEARYPTRIGSYSKGLKHDPHTGEPDVVAGCTAV